MFELSIKDLKKCLIKDLKQNFVPMITSSPGMGKSDLAKEIAKEFRLKLIDVRVSTHEPVDFTGYPDPDEHRMKFKPADFFPIEGLDEPPKGYEGWLLFLN